MWRVPVALLWFVAGWYVGSVVSVLFDLHAAVTPTLALVGPLLVAAGAVAARRSSTRRDRRRHWAPMDAPLPAGQESSLETTGT